MTSALSGDLVHAVGGFSTLPRASQLRTGPCHTLEEVTGECREWSNRRLPSNPWLASVNAPHHPTESHDPTICPPTAKHFDPRTTQPRRCCPPPWWWSQGRGGRVQHWLSGRNEPNMRNLLRLSTALDVEPMEFIKQDDPGSIIRSARSSPHKILFDLSLG